MKVGIQGHDDPILGVGTLEQILIARIRHADLARMHDVQADGT